MKILVIGNGGREHALVWKLAKSSTSPTIYCAPGNPGIAREALTVPIKPDDIDGLINFAKEKSISLAVVGPELPLTLGISDRFWAEGIPIVGPTREAARIESSKAFSKIFMERHGIPTAPFKVFEEPGAAMKYIREHPEPLVVKADGLAGGKGVIVAQDAGEAASAVESMMVRKTFGDAGSRIVIEEKLMGSEVTLLVFTDGKTVVPMVPAQDYKRIFDQHQGPNTGGMGAYSPASALSQDLIDQLLQNVAARVIEGLEKEGNPYRGILYIGVMLTREGPKVLEFNARFGDPETQVVLPRLENDLLEVLDAVAHGRLDQITIRWKPEAAVCVVAASAGYPGKPETGVRIQGLKDVESLGEVFVFHSGTVRRGEEILTAGGRVLGITALGKNLSDAREKAYAAVSRIHFEGMQYRRDIALEVDSGASR